MSQLKNSFIEEQKEANNSLYSLYDYLSQEFIPENVTYRYGDETELGNIEVISTISFRKLDKLNLSEIELKYALDYLKDQSIMVEDIPSYMLESYEDKPSRKLTALSDTENVARINEYTKTKDINLRNKIVTDNLAMISELADEFAKMTGEPVEDLIGHGVAGLIEAIEDYPYRSKNTTVSFNKYAKNKITAAIWKETALLNNRHLNIKLCSAQGTVDKLDCEMFGDRRELLLKVIDLMLKNGEIDLDEAQKIHMAYNIKNPLFLQDDFNDYQNDDSCNLDEVVLKDDIMDVLEDLSQAERQVIELKIVNNFTVNEISKILGVSYSTVSKLMKRAIRKLKHPVRSNKLRNYIS